MKKIIQPLLLLSLFFLFQNCIEDDFDSSLVPDPNTGLLPQDQEFQAEYFGNTTTGNFLGIVTGANNEKLENVQITIGNLSTMTDRNGMFVLNDVSVFENFAYIEAKKEGYLDGSRVVIPKTESANTIRINMIKKVVSATVSSGQTSEVSVSGGGKVKFSGEFINADGSPYVGNVEVIANYLAPNSPTTFLQMPGSLFAQNDANEARNLETYGMISVNLFSSSGEPLNIHPNSPATLEFPVHYTQTSIAPNTIDLWYFDEHVGYWKDEGQAVRDGNMYIAEVTHFTWWNCDIPFESVQLCFNLTPTNLDNNTPYYVSIIRANNQQVIYGGILYSDEVECGLIPENEEVEVSVYGVAGNCNSQVLYQQTHGGYTLDTSINISFTDESTVSQLSGMALNCDGNPITNGYIYINDVNIFNISNGSFSVGVVHCLLNQNITFQVFDFDTMQWGTIDNVILDGGSTNIGTVTTCGTSGGIYNGNVILRTQSEVDDFGALNFEQISGELFIGDYNAETDITDLSSLLSLESVTQKMQIVKNPGLSNLNGLNNVNSVYELIIIENSGLQTLASLSGLNTVELGIRITYNNGLQNLNGLENMSNSGEINLTLSHNSSLTSIDALQNITELFRLRINDNPQLTSIAALSNVIAATSIDLYRLPALTSLQGLNQITTLNLFRITDNDLLTDLSAMSNLTSADVVSIGGNDALTSLNGLENLVFTDWMLIGKDLEFDIIVDLPNPNLTNFCALQNLFINGSYPTTSSIFTGIFIENNPFNPSVQNIIDGNCSQ